MSQAQTFLTQLREGGESAIDALLLRRASEELYLDFKKSSNDGRGTKNLSGDDLEHFRKAISGFGNSGGGLLVWGVDCPSRSDVAEKKSPLDDAARFKRLLDTAIGGATLPPHGGVENFVIAPRPDGTGFVASHIPYAENSPLQYVGSSVYYMRAGSTFQHIPHAMLAAMFGRRPSPQLAIHPHNFSLIKFPEQLAFRARVDLQIVNQGLGIARDLYATLKVVSLPTDGAAYQVGHSEDSRMEGMRSWTFGNSLTSLPGSRFPPGTFVETFQLNVKVSHPVKDRLQVEIVAGCENGPPAYLTFEQSKERLQHTLDLVIQSGAAEGWLARRVFGLATDGAVTD